jgi:hypothetical protein
VTAYGSWPIPTILADHGFAERPTVTPGQQPKWPTPTATPGRPTEGTVRFVRERWLAGELTEEEARGMLHGRHPAEAWGEAENAAEGHHKGLPAYKGPWPTPVASDATRGPDLKRAERERSGTDDLTTSVHRKENWPTPRSSPSGWYPETDETYNKRGRKGMEGLATEVVRREGMWPTPTAGVGTGFMSGPDNDVWRPSLEGAVKMSPEGPPPKVTADEFKGKGRGAAAKAWPTPTSSDRKGSRNTTLSRKNPGSYRQGTTLTDAAWQSDERWRTPTSRDHKGGSSQKWREREDGDKTPTLSDQAITREGSLGRLNPDWVEWLMGWPVGWTALEPLSDRWGALWEAEVAVQNRGWDEEPPGIPRLNKDVPNQTSRLRSIGNGWVPLCGAVAFVALVEVVRQVDVVLKRQDEEIDLFGLF